MKQQGRTKIIEVKYKGYTLKQVPWNSFEGKRYAEWLYNPKGECVLHAGYSKYRSRKQLRLQIRDDVNLLLPMLMRGAEIRKIDDEDERNE